GAQEIQHASHGRGTASMHAEDQDGPRWPFVRQIRRPLGKDSAVAAAVVAGVESIALMMRTTSTSGSSASACTEGISRTSCQTIDSLPRLPIPSKEGQGGTSSGERKISIGVMVTHDIGKGPWDGARMSRMRPQGGNRVLRPSEVSAGHGPWRVASFARAQMHGAIPAHTPRTGSTDPVLHIT